MKQRLSKQRLSKQRLSKQRLSKQRLSSEFKNILLTKSRYTSGIKCAKWLWLSFNEPGTLPDIDKDTQHRFDEGHKIHELAKSLFPDGINIEEVLPIENDKISRELLKKRMPLFEAGFMHKNSKCYARADILIPIEKNEWDLIEVKSAARVKEEYLHDISFQKYCFESAGLKIRKCFVLHVNSQYVRSGEIEPKEFFIQSEVTEEVEELMHSVPEKIEILFKITRLKKCPEIMDGEEYHKDYFKVHEDDKFWKEHPECDILDLSYGGKKALELFNSGILRIKDIPKEHYHKFNGKQRIQCNCHKNGNHFANHKELDSFIKKLKYPLYFLDFESYNPAIPLYDGLKPYQPIPFQFSLHILENPNSKPNHISFIAEGSADPRPKLAEELKKSIGKAGNVIVYNLSFEKTILNKLGEFFQEYKSHFNSITERMVDLAVPFKNFSYYHPKQNGSASLKNVLPALTGVTYEDFEISNGSDASLSYLFITHGSYGGTRATPQEKKKILADLERYCGLDSEGMILILEKLRELVKES